MKQSTTASTGEKVCFSYIRFSSAEQAGGSSENRQSIAPRIAQEKGWTFRADLNAADLGVSAYKGSNVETLNNIVKLAEQGKIPKGSVMIIEALDRLTRLNVDEAYQLFRRVIKSGIEIYTDFSRRHLTHDDLNSITSILATIMELDAAHQFSDKLSMRIKGSWKDRKLKAAAGEHINIKLPAWLEHKDRQVVNGRISGGTYSVDKNKAKVIQQIFEWYNQGLGAATICAKLVADKVPNIAKPIKGRTEKWHPNYILKLIKMKELVGSYTGVSPEIVNYFPRVISDELFYACQAKIAVRYNYKGQKNNNPQPFSHLLKCALCGEGVVRTTSRSYIYLECQGARIKACQKATLDYRSTEKALLHIISSADALATDTTDKTALKMRAELDAIQGKIAELESKTAKATKLLTSNPSAALAKVLQGYEAERKALDKQLNEKRNVTYLHDHRSDWRKVKAMIQPKVDASFLKGGIVVPQTVVVKADGTLAFIGHTEGSEENDVIALRESLRGYIERIDFNLPKRTAKIVFKTGKKINVEFIKHTGYPRTHSYRTDKGSWTKITANME